MKYRTRIVVFTKNYIIPDFCHSTISESRTEPRDIETKITRKDTELRQTFQAILTDNFTSVNLQLKMVSIVQCTPYRTVESVSL